MRIGSIRPAAGATRPSKRRGKGTATGVGGTAGKGHKGHRARAGGKLELPAGANGAAAEARKKAGKAPRVEAKGGEGAKVKAKPKADEGDTTNAG